MGTVLRINVVFIFITPAASITMCGVEWTKYKFLDTLTHGITCLLSPYDSFFFVWTAELFCKTVVYDRCCQLEYLGIKKSLKVKVILYYHML